MSYILDALRKSEQERAQGDVPGLHAVHASIGSKADKRPVWPYLLGLVLLVNVLLVLWWMGGGEEPAPETASQGATSVVAAPVAMQPPVTTGKPTAEGEPAESVAPAQPEAIQQKREAQKAAPDKPEAIKPATVDARKPPSSQPEVGKSPPTEGKQASARGSVLIAETPLTDAQGALLTESESAAQSQPQDMDETPRPLAEEYVQPLTELPQSIQGKIPAISYAGHVYSENPLRRSVLINGRKLREGSVVEGDLVLEEIRLGYSVFSYQGTRFRLDMLRNWPG